MFLNSNSRTNSLLAVGTKPLGTYREDTGLKTVDRIKVPCRTLDSFCSENSIRYFDLLKIDVQGGELEVLKGSKMSLSNKNVGMIYL